MKRIFCFFVFLVICVPAVEAQLYRWKDKNGNLVIGDTPPKKDSSSAEKIVVGEPLPPAKPSPTSRSKQQKAPIGADWKKSGQELQSRRELREQADADTERAKDQKQRACEDARAKQNYADSIRGRTVWQVNPETGEQTELSSEDRVAMENDARKTIQMNNCEQQ